MLKLDDYQIHDVANALKRFFRLLDSPLLTDELYSLWINAASLCLVYSTFYCSQCLQIYLYCLNFMTDGIDVIGTRVCGMQLVL